jgi:chromosome segregation ATPase
VVTVLKRLLQFSIVLIGGLGVALCLAVAIVVWLAAARVSAANDKVFAVVDTALVTGRERVLDAKRRVQEAKITTEDVKQGVESWARREVPQRLASRPEVENTIERLARGLQQVDRGLEISGASVQSVQQALGFASSLDAPVDPALVDPLLQKLNLLRGRVSQSTETIDAIRARLEHIASGESLEERLSRFAQLTLRMVATLSDIDARLNEVADGLNMTRTRAEDAKNRIGRNILLAEIGALLLVAWMAVGQFFLARDGWARYRLRSN